MGLAEGVAADDQRGGLDVVHRHATERLADVPGRSGGVGLTVGTLGVDVDQAHLGGAQRPLQLAVAAVARVVGDPGGLGAPVDGGVRSPLVDAATGKAERLEAHRLERDVAGEDQQVAPGQRPAVLLLDRPQQPPRLVDVDVVGPGVQRREALLAMTAAAAAVEDAVGARRMPCHADHQSAVVTEVGRPPVLRVGHDRLDVGLHSLRSRLLNASA